MKEIAIWNEDPSVAASYEEIPIAYEITSRIDLRPLLERGELVANPCPTRWKDYDSFPEERPSAHAQRYDIANWGFMGAFAGEDRVAAAIVAFNTAAFEMLEGRDDRAILVDLRVHPRFRGCGLGRKLFRAAAAWARSKQCTELMVETQDTNVAACRLYARSGCTLLTADPAGYGPDLDEAKLIWRLRL